jgi:iron complex outermembrane recepter protein
MNCHAKESAARALLASVFVCVALCCATLAGAAETERQYDIDIGELPLSEALQQFSDQTQLQYGYLPTDDAEEQLVVGPVKGHLTVTEILAKLLPAGFTFEWVNARTLSILSPPVNVPPGGVNAVVAGEDQQRSELSKEQQLSMANGGGKSGSARGPYDFNWKVIVEASKIFDGLNLELPGTVIDREDIDASGMSTLPELMSYVTQQPFTTSESLLGDGTQVANLRGLGLDSTLVLINGRRTTATASSVTSNAFDLNSIPLGAVDRVEIVSDSMSAIHGADAIAGVVNIVFRDGIREPRLDIDYGAADGGGVERHASFGVGGGSSRARGSIVADYFDRSPLLGQERDRVSNQDFRRFGSIDLRSTAASPGNVRSATFNNLPGLPSSFAAIPVVHAGAALTPSDFLPTAGQQNLESLYKYRSVAYARARKGLVAQGEYAIAPRTTLFGEFLYVDRDSEVDSEPSVLASALVPRTNPHNPFGEDVLVDVLLKDLGPRTQTHSSQMARVVGGVRGQIHNWDWETAVHRSRDQDLAVRTGELDPMRVAAALSATDADSALNVFGGRDANNAELLESLLAEPARTRSATEATQATAYLRGPLASSPAGRIDLVVGGEWREEQAQYVVSPTLQGVPSSPQRSVSAAFAELRLPIVGRAAEIPAVHELSVMLSGRFDDYSDIGDSFNPEYAVLWEPISGLSVRTSWSQSFRPPSLVDLYLPLLEAPVPIVDTARNGEIAFPIWRAGGNPNLQPASADSFSATASFTPAGQLGLRLGASYWRIHADQTIGVPAAERLLRTEEQFADRVIRAEASAEDTAAGIPGRLELIDIRRLNFGSIRTSGLDFTAAIDFDTRVGRFTPQVSATWVHDYETSDLAVGPDVNRVGVANLQGTITRWKAVARMNWNRGGFGLSGALRYVPSYDDVQAFGGRNGRRVDAQGLLDLQASLDLGKFAPQESPWNDFEIRAGALNVFDSQPPFAEVGWLAGYDPTQADLRQRFWYVKLAKKF